MANKPKASGPADKGLEVISRPPEFFRAQRRWTSEPTIVPYTELTDEQVQELRSEPLLVVREVDIQPAPAVTPTA